MTSKELLKRLKEVGFTFRRTKKSVRIFTANSTFLIGVKRTKTGSYCVFTLWEDTFFSSGKKALEYAYLLSVKSSLQIM